MNIAYAIDRNFLQPLTVSLRSLLKHSKPSFKAKVFVLHSDLTEEEMQRVERNVSSQKLELVWQKIDPSSFSKFPAGLHFSSANYFRIRLPSLLPISVSSVLYLDADTVILSDIEELFREADPSVPAQACLDYCGKLNNPLINFSAGEKIQADPDAPYFNSGVMFFHLDHWRRENIEGKILDFCQRHPETLFFVDQTPINIVLQGRIKALPSEWNVQTVHPKVISREWNVPFVAQNWEQAKLRHFTTEFKPWGLGADLPDSAHYRNICSQLEWE